MKAVVAFAVLPCAWAEEPAPLSASLSGDAKSSYEEGRDLATRGDYANAYRRFAAAFELSKDRRLLWNMASCQHLLHHPAATATLLERYLAGGDLSAKDRRAAETVLDAVVPLTGTVRFAGAPGARIFVDDVEVGVLPLEPVRLDAGARRISATKAGATPFAQTVNVPARGEIEVPVELEASGHATLVVRAGSADLVTVDGKVVGVGNVTVPLAPGPHQVHVAGHGEEHDHDRTVTLRPDERVVLDVAPPPRDSHTWMWVGGGVVVAAAAGITAALLLHHGSSDTPNTTHGSVPPGTIQLR